MVQIPNSGAFSTILGGACNTIPVGIAYASVHGCNITASASYAFHTNCVISANMPDIATSPVSGTLAYHTVNAALAGAGYGFTLGQRIVLIKP